MRFSSESGQSTVEAAVLLPLLFVVLGLIIQPVLLLYTQCIMNATANECCRLVATSTSDDASIRAYMERRLSAIPPLDIFHVDKEWELEWSSSDSGEAQVHIVNHVRPLPLIGITAGLIHTIAEDGTILQQAKACASAIPEWTRQQGYVPSDWADKWK